MAQTRWFVGMVALAVFALVAPAHGRPRAPGPGSLAVYAPSDCGLFIQIERPAKINPNLRDINAWKLLQLVLGSDIQGGDSSTDWYDVLIANVAGESTEAMRELFSERAALVAPTWTQPADGVILIQIPKRALLKHLVGPGRVKSEKRDGTLSIYESTRGLLIATDGRTVIISQSDSSSTFFAKSVELLKGKSKNSLQNTKQFAMKVKELPKRRIPQGFFYLSSKALKTTTQGTDSVFPWPGVRVGVVGMYVTGVRVDFLVRASLAEPRRTTSPRVNMRRLKHLPRSTLVAWATSLDVDEVFELFVSATPETSLAPYAAFLADRLDLELLKRDVVSKVGPRMMLAWGHDFLAEEGGSSLGLLIESTDASAVKHALDATVNKLVDSVNAAPVVGNEDDLRVTTEEILGADVTVVELADYLADTPPSNAAMSLVSTMRVCYTALDDWIIVAWNVNHMRELIASHHGAHPGLGEFTDVARLRPLRRGPTVLGVAQLATVAAVLEKWLDRAENEPDSILNLYIRPPGGAPGVQGRVLGLGLAPQTHPGRVPVAKVYQDGPCYGSIEIGDDILAISEQVLDLEDSVGDLREHVRHLVPGRAITLRVEREGTLIDVKVVVDRSGNPRITLAADAVRALRRLQVLCRHLAFATFSVTRSDPDSYQAHFRLRFNESR